MKNILLFIIISSMFFSCGFGGGDHIGNQRLGDIRENMTDAEREGEETRKERIKKGDTIAISYEKLADFLPKKVEKYKKNGDLVSSEKGMSGKSYSNVEQAYINDADHNIIISIIDYSGANAQFARETAYFDSGMRINDRTAIAGGVKIKDNMKAWEIYEKRTRVAKLDVAVSDRILLKILASHQEDTEFVKEIAENMDLEKLAGF